MCIQRATVGQIMPTIRTRPYVDQHAVKSRFLEQCRDAAGGAGAAERSIPWREIPRHGQRPPDTRGLYAAPGAAAAGQPHRSGNHEDWHSRSIAPIAACPGVAGVTAGDGSHDSDQKACYRRSSHLNYGVRRLRIAIRHNERLLCVLTPGSQRHGWYQFKAVCLLVSD